ncbi:hypothetical protein BISA_2084 [Bifidobacterium saguini DSM 23967]|uniref:Uncharacterized protein n=1 Tax=Bifidobacterium saguini DSM 23967 TaxID=1437607 RepID=A0A087D6H1_9BIFI|nr:hypothetical protein BISA_2084 [Bifidobacterium saguini DSM 23967]
MLIYFAMDIISNNHFNLHDFFKFTLNSVKPIAQGDNQPYLDGYRVSFNAFIGTKSLGSIHVDLVTHQGH